MPPAPKTATAVPPAAPRDAIPYATFERLVRIAQAEEHRSAAVGAPTPDKAILDAEVRPALAAMLHRMRDEGRLRPVPGGAGHVTPFLFAWDGFVRGESPGKWETEEGRMRTIVGAFDSGAVIYHYLSAGSALRRNPGSPAEPVIRDAYERMLATLETGDIENFYTTGQHCQVDGLRYDLEFKGWNPRMSRGHGRDAKPMESLEVAPFREVEVTFETGDLVISDWIRIPEFTEVVEAGGNPDEVGSVSGREAMAERYAREHGFVGVHVGGAYASVFGRDGCLVVGMTDCDAEPADAPIGRFNGGYRGATIVDRARLVAIVASKVGPAAAEAKVAAYLRDPEEEVVRAKVEPGTYRVYMSGDVYAFADTFRPDDLDLDRLQPRMVLSPRELSLDAAPAPAP